MMEWSDLVLVVEDYLSEADLGPIAEAVELLIKNGTEDEKEREQIALSIKNILQGREGSPFRQGVRSSLPVSVKVNIDKVSRMVYEASKVYFESVPAQLHRKHGKSGGGGYVNAKEYANNEKKKIRTDLQRRFQKGSWDGTLDSLEGQIGVQNDISF